MTYAIIGSGNLGAALARRFARSGIAVTIANTRGPDSLLELVKELGSAVMPARLQDALDADVVLLAMPFSAHRTIAQVHTQWKGKTVIDAMNFRQESLAPLGGLQSSDFVARSFPGANVVKAFNQLPAARLASAPTDSGGKRVVFIAGNDEEATTEVAALASSLGFAPIVLGKIAEGGRLLRYRGPLVLHNLVKPGS